MKNYSRYSMVDSNRSNRSILTYLSCSSTHNLLKYRGERNIIMLCMDLTAKTSKHIIDAAMALSNYDFTTTIITCKYSKKMCANLNNARIIVLRPKIPETIFGRFRSILYTIRSMYAAFWTIVWCSVKKPALVFCEADRIVLPILHFGNYKIIYFQYYFNLISRNTPVKNTYLNSDFLTRKCMQFADAILVPNMQYRSIFKQSFKTARINPIVMYPHLNTKSLENQELCSIRSYFPFMTQNSFIFLVLGHYDERSNFELAVRAFEHLILIANEENKNNLYLIVYGRYSKHLSEERNYFKKIKQLVKSSKSAEHYILLEYSALCEKLSLIFGCTVLLHTTVDEIFNRYVLEAMFMKKAIIATRTGFMKEIIKDGVTGFLTEPNVVHFAVAMNKILSMPKIANIMGTIGHIEFIRRYSFESYGERLLRIIYEYGDISEALMFDTSDSIFKDETQQFFR